MNKCFHGFDPTNCITCIFKELKNERDEKNEMLKKPKKEKKPSSKLSRDEKIRIAALNAEVNIKPKNIPPLYWAKIFEHYIRTGETSE